jgi:Cofilin/tropomyosin-type actin-binding protein
MNHDLPFSDSFMIIKARKFLLYVFLSLYLTELVFIYSCPSSSTIKQRMLYASSRRAILAIATEVGVKVDTKIETSEVDELTLKYLIKEIHGVEVVEEKKTFARPRGPPKRTPKVVENASENQDSAE